MCFYVSKEKGYSKAKVAKENIVCYKWLKEGLKSPYQFGFTYEVGKVQPKVELVVDGYDTIHKGYHSFTEKVFKEGELFYKSFYKCVIPVGSMYYENPERGEYVSDSIVVTTDQPLSWEEATALTGLGKKVDQEEFNTFFTELIKKGVQRRDFSDTHYILCNKNGQWLFDVNQDSKNPYFWYSHIRVYPLFEEKFGANTVQLTWLMQPVLESHFKLKGVTPLSVRALKPKCWNHTSK